MFRMLRDLFAGAVLHIRKEEAKITVTAKGPLAILAVVAVVALVLAFGGNLTDFIRG